MGYLPNGSFVYHPAAIKMLVRALKRNGVKSREDLMGKYDVDTKDYTALKGIGDVLSELLVWLRGQSIDKWEELTGLPGFNKR